MTNIVLCGGSGTRLWPISRTVMPKQFVKLFNDESLFQLTIKRNRDRCTQQFIVSNAEQYFLAADQLEELSISSNKFLSEPKLFFQLAIVERVNPNNFSISPVFILLSLI